MGNTMKRRRRQILAGLIPAFLFLACGRSTMDAREVEPTDPGSLTCEMPSGDLDYACTVDSDCVAVPGGEPCAPDCRTTCKTTVVNAKVAPTYNADFVARLNNDSGVPNCKCPCLTRPYCCHGKCENACGGCDGP